MRHRLFTPKRVLALVAAALLIASFLPFGAASAIASIPRKFVRAVTAPVSAPLNALGRALRPPRHVEPDLGSADQMRAELGLALQRINSLQSQLKAANERIAVLSQVRQTAGMTGSRLIDARVSGFSSRRNHPVLHLTRGTSSGVNNGMAAVWGFNLVGVIENAGSRNADVRLITAPKTSMEVTFAPPTADPSAPRYTDRIKLADDGRTFEAVVNLDAPVQVGDLAHLNDAAGNWPPLAKGFVVGRVIDVNDRTSNPLLLKKVIVQPLVDLPRLNTVQVIEPVG